MDIWHLTLLLCHLWVPQQVQDPRRENLSEVPFYAQGHVMPGFPQSNVDIHSICANQRPPSMSRNEFEDKKANLKQRREVESLNERVEHLRDRFREASRCGNGTPVLSKEATSGGHDARPKRPRSPVADMNRSYKEERGHSQHAEHSRHSSARLAKRRGCRYLHERRPEKSTVEEASGRWDGRYDESSKEECHFKRRRYSRREAEEREQGSEAGFRSRYE